MGNNYESKGIWISTQIVEASLDIDFDLLFTELSDLSGLFQRMGRVYRKRTWNNKGYNVFVFVGKDKCSGVGNIIYKDIFELSKNLIANMDGPLSEKKKIDLINRIYDYNTIKNTKYYKKLKDNLEYVNTFNLYELEKKDVSKIFRNIDSISVIPKNIYDKNKDYITELINKYSEKGISKKDNIRLKSNYQIIQPLSIIEN
nr:hypothetical protein [Marinitoga lauensis]